MNRRNQLFVISANYEQSMLRLFCSRCGNCHPRRVRQLRFSEQSRPAWGAGRMTMRQGRPRMRPNDGGHPAANFSSWTSVRGPGRHRDGRNPGRRLAKQPAARSATGRDTGAVGLPGFSHDQRNRGALMRLWTVADMALSRCGTLTGDG